MLCLESTYDHTLSWVGGERVLPRWKMLCLESTCEVLRSPESVGQALFYFIWWTVSIAMNFGCVTTGVWRVFFGHSTESLLCNISKCFEWKVGAKGKGEGNGDGKDTLAERKKKQNTNAPAGNQTCQPTWSFTTNLLGQETSLSQFAWQITEILQSFGLV